MLINEHFFKNCIEMDVKMPDRRNLKTKQAIKKAFLSQLQYKSLNQISVTKIANIANIGRGTFYLHYLDIEDLYEQIINEIFGEIALFFDNAYPTNNSNNLKNLITEIITFISTNKNLFLIFIKTEGSEKTISKLKNLFNEKVFQESIEIFDINEKDKEYLEIESIFVISGLIGVIEKWLNGGLIHENKHIIDILHNMIMKLNV